jgi:hypothetical protein
MADKKEMERQIKDMLGRRLAAALIGYTLGQKSMDYTLKRYIADNEISPAWGEIAYQLYNSIFTGASPSEERLNIVSGQMSRLVH